MYFLNKHRFILFVLFFITALFFISRLYNLTSLPIFTDEAIYLRWAQIAKQDANWRFISLTDGKQPMFIWLVMIMMRFVHDPLLAGRLISVGSGFITMIGLFFVGREVFGKTSLGVLSAFLYVIYPMGLVYDRMALYDSLVGTFSVWSLYLTVVLIRRFRLDTALILGMLAGGGVLTKTSGFFNIYLLPFSLLLFDFKNKNRYKLLARWIGLATIVMVLTYIFYSVLRLSPFFHIVDEKNTIFVYPLKQWLDHPFNFFIGNWKAVWDWFTLYFTWPIVVLIIGSFFISLSYFREKFIFLLWFLLPALALALFGNTLYPRFIFFMTLSLIPLAAFTLNELFRRLNKKYLLYYLTFAVLLILPLRSDYLILSDFVHASIPRSDLDQYAKDWPSGGGIKEAVAFFTQQAKKGKIYIVTQGTFGLMPYALELYLVQNPNITIEGIWPIDQIFPKKMLDISKKMPTYFVFYQPCVPCADIGVAPTEWKSIELIYTYKKYNSNRYFSIYRVKP